MEKVGDPYSRMKRHLGREINVIRLILLATDKSQYYIICIQFMSDKSKKATNSWRKVIWGPWLPFLFILIGLKQYLKD